MSYKNAPLTVKWDPIVWENNDVVSIYNQWFSKWAPGILMGVPKWTVTHL